MSDTRPSEVGRCGDEAPRCTFPKLTEREQADIAAGVIPIPRTFCCLPYGHAGWHKGDDGSEWTPRPKASQADVQGVQNSLQNTDETDG